MAWNQPGGGNGNNNPDPWGGKKQPSPPEIDKLIAQLWQKLRGFFKNGLPGKNKNHWRPSPSSPEHHKEFKLGAGIVALIILIIWMLSGLFIVNPAEQAVVLRFGQFSDVLQPGLHWMARFIDTKYLVDVQKIYSFSLHGDFLTKSSEQGDLPNQYLQPDLNKKLSAATNSSDKSKNLVNVELNVQYRISDPRAYLFNVVDPDNTIKQVASGALSDVVGQMKLDEVLTTGREFLSSGVLERIKQILMNYHTGLSVMAVTLRKVQAPDQVREAFSDVNRADQDKATYIQQAQAYASKVVPLAQGQAARILADANAHQQQVVLTAQADIATFQALLNVYKTAPEVTRQRMYLDALQTVLKNTSKVLIDSGNNMIYLPIDKFIKSAKQDNANNSLPVVSQAMSELNNDSGQSATAEVK